MNFEFKQTLYKWYDPICVSLPKVSLKILISKYLFNIHMYCYFLRLLITALSLVTLFYYQKYKGGDGM